MAELTPEQIAEALKLSNDLNKSVEERLEKYAEENKAMEAYIEKLKTVENIQDRDLAIAKNILELEKNRLAELELRARNQDQYSEKLQKQLEEQQQIVNVLKEGLDVEKSINEEIGTQTGLYQQVHKETKKIAVALQTGKASTLALNRSMQGFDKIASGGINKLVSVSKELFFTFDSVSKGFAKATQLGDAYTDTVTNTYKELNLYGVSLEEAAKANRELIATVSDFTLSTESQRQAVSTQVALLGELGVATKDSATAIQNSMKFMGSSMTGAASDVAQLTQDAKNLGLEAGAMVSEYAKMGPELAKFGNNSIRTFKDLARISKITGMEMQKVLNITNKFDTFEGAATQAGQLNAALGGNFVNAMDLMMATDPAERFGMIRDSILDAGLSFDEMSYYQKQFYTESLGLGDVGDLAMMLSGNMDSLVGSTNDSAASLISQKEKAQANMKIMEQLKSVFLELGEAVIPLAKNVTGILQFFQKSPKLVDGLIKGFIAWKAISTVLAIRNGFLAASFFAMAAGQTASAVASRRMAASVIPLTLALAALGVIGLMMRSPSLLVAAFVGLAAGVMLAGIASDKAVNQFRRLAPALVGVGLGVFMITGGIALMALAFSQLDISQMIGIGAILITMGVGLYFLAPALAAAAPGLAAFGIAALAAAPGIWAIAGAVALVGGVIGLVAAGIGLMAQGFAAMFAVLDVPKIIALSGLMTGLAVGAPFFVMAGIGLAAMAVGMGLLGLSLKIVSTKDLAAIALFTSSLASIKVEEIKAVASAIREVADAMDSIPVMPTIMFTHVMETAAMTAAAIHALRGSQVMQPQKELATAGGGGKQADWEVTVPIELKLEGQVFDTKVVKIYKRERRIEAREIKDNER